MNQAIDCIDSLDLPKNHVRAKKWKTILSTIAQHRIHSLKMLILTRRESQKYSDEIAFEFARVGMNLIAHIAEIRDNEPPDDTRSKMREFATIAGVSINNELELQINLIISSPLYINAKNAGHAVNLTVTEWRAHCVKYLFPTGCTAEQVKELRDERKREYDRVRKEHKRRINGSRPLTLIISSSWRAYCTKVNIPERTLRYHRHKGRAAVIRYIQRKGVEPPPSTLLSSIPFTGDLNTHGNDSGSQEQIMA